MSSIMEDKKWCLFAVIFAFTSVSAGALSEGLPLKPVPLDNVAEVSSITFLVNVNHTYKHIPPFDNSSYTCTTTNKTSPLSPDTPLKKAEKIMFGNCDNGSLVFTVRSDDKGNTMVVPAYYSSYIGVANPWTCTIDWNYKYRVPSEGVGTADESLLPGCFTTKTYGEEGIEVASYWFYILDWGPSSSPTGLKQQGGNSGVLQKPPSVSSVTFLVAVNQTDNNCLTTSKTPPLQPGVLHNHTGYIYVGKCDYGALDFNISTSTDKQGQTHSTIDLVFHSHDIEDASPPTCSIAWDYSYKIPSGDNSKSSLLPGCYVQDSREGFHMTYYWFYVLEWGFSDY